MHDSSAPTSPLGMRGMLGIRELLDMRRPNCNAHAQGLTTVPTSAQPDCLLMAYQYPRIHSPHPPPRTYSSPQCNSRSSIGRHSTEVRSGGFFCGG
jgi:hypothetical protein